MQEKNELSIENGIIGLKKNGHEVFCYRQPIAFAQNAVGQPQAIKQPCNNCCPAFKIAQSADKTFVHITCSGLATSYLIE